MTDKELRDLAKKYHTPGDFIKKDWNPIYKGECEKINRKSLEEEIMKKYAPRKINTEVKRSTLFVDMGTKERSNKYKDLRNANSYKRQKH